MTRCIEKYAIKSSVYNQTGESYGEQLSRHKSMCDHIRRILGAKHVVDTRNARYQPKTTTPKRGGCRPVAMPACKLRIFQPCPSDETIDKLAYDTELHPADNIIQIKCQKKSKEREKSCCRTKNEPQNNNCTCGSNNCSFQQQQQLTKKQTFSKRIEDCYGSGAKTSPYQNSPYYSRACSSNRRAISNPRSRASSCGRKPDHCPELSALSPACNELAQSPKVRYSRRCSHDAAQQASPQQIVHCPCPSKSDEEARYIQFVRDITQDIIKSGVHKDEQIKAIFEKHLRENEGELNRRKMLYEIYQLKISLNMDDDEDEEDEVEANLVYAENFSSQRGPKPPTPPKTLNDSKVIDKLESFKKAQDDEEDCCCPTECQKKCVILVDANPDIVITERDVLTTLVDNDLNPQLIERIHQNLFRKAKDVQVSEVKAIDKVDEKSAADAAALVKSHSKERLHGILRKECKSYSGVNKSPLRCQPQSSQRRPGAAGYAARSSRQAAVEKCAKWKLDPAPPCDCKSPSPRSSPKTTTPCSPARRTPSPLVVPPIIVCGPKNELLTPTKKRNKSRSPSPWRDSPSEDYDRDNDDEDIAEELESEAEGTNSQVNNKEDDEKEDQQLSTDEVESIASVKSNKSIKSTDLSEKEEVCDEKCQEEQMRKALGEKIGRLRPQSKGDHSLSDLPSISDVADSEPEDDNLTTTSYGRLADRTADDTLSTRTTPAKGPLNNFTETWKLSAVSSIASIAASSESDSTRTGLSDNLKRPDALEVGMSIMHPGRKSLGLGSVGVHGAWNEGLNEFQTQPGKYCQAGCRTNDGHTCSENCKYFKLGCKNLVSPTECLIKTSTRARTRFDE